MRSNVLSTFKWVCLGLLGLLAVAGIMTVLVSLLSSAYLVSQKIAALAGFTFVLPQELQKDVLTVSGVVVTAVVALVGIRLQNESADKRHKIDAQRSLLKDILLDASANAAEQYIALVLLAQNDLPDENSKTQDVAGKMAATFARVQMVASLKTINALLAVNEQYARSLTNIMLWKPEHPLDDLESRLVRTRLFYEEANKYQEKCWQFVVAARDEISAGFDSDAKYLADMDGSMKRLKGFFDDLEAKAQSMK